MDILKLKVLLKKIYLLLCVKFSSIFDFILYLLKIPSDQKKTNEYSDKKIIIYLSEGLHLRIPRSVKYLKKEIDFYSILICHKDGFYKMFHNTSIDKTILFRNKWHLFRVFLSFKSIDLIHASGPHSYYPALILQKKLCPFIYDMQDILVCYYGTNPHKRWLIKELPFEHFCLEKADGVIGYSPELNEGYRKYRITKKPKTLFFPLYCELKKNEISFDKIDIKKEIHIVYVGGVAGSFRDKKHYGSIQFFSLIESFRKQRIHFHLFPSPSRLREDYIEYEQISETNPFFHFHEPVSQNELSKHISLFHFGLIPFSIDHSGQSIEKYKYATSLKLFNYIEAGLPVIISKDLIYQSWIVQRYRSGLVITYPELYTLNSLIDKTNYSQLISDLFTNREKISLQKNIIRMAEFYKKVGSFN